MVSDTRKWAEYEVDLSDAGQSPSIVVSMPAPSYRPNLWAWDTEGRLRDLVDLANPPSAVDVNGRSLYVIPVPTYLVGHMTRMFSHYPDWLEPPVVVVTPTTPRTVADLRALTLV